MTVRGVAARRSLLGLGALGAGATLAVEAVVNGGLGDLVRPVPAAATSNAVSLVAVLLLAPLLPDLRDAFRTLRGALRRGEVRWYHCVGGVGGGFLVLTQSTVVAPIGAALFMLAIVAGQTLAGIVADHVGLGPGVARPMTATRWAGAALIMAAVTLPVLAGTPGPGVGWLIVLPLVAGAGLSLQLAVNGRVDESAHSPWPAVLMSFLAGVLVLGAALIVEIVLVGAPQGWPSDPRHYAGGLCGVVFVLSSVLLVRHLGVLAAGFGMIAGQLLGSIVLDAWMRGPVGPDGIRLTSLSALVLLAGVAVVSAGEDSTRTMNDPTRPAVNERGRRSV